MRLRLPGRPKPLPPELDRPEVLAFIAAMLAWRDGDAAPVPPKQLEMSVEELTGRLADPDIRGAAWWPACRRWCPSRTGPSNV